MQRMKTPLSSIRPLHGSPGSLFLAAGIGTFAFLISRISTVSMLDPLVLALVLGIALRTLLGRRLAPKGAGLAVNLLMPIGIGFYALAHLNFGILQVVQPATLALLFAVIAAFLLVIGLMGRFLGQKKEISSLVAVGSAICGASAIAITAPAVNADQDDISVSLLAVTIAAMLGLFVILPLLGIVLDLNGWTYSLMSGSTLQFTGFVKEAVQRMPHLDALESVPLLTVFALNIKAVRYLGLLVAIPVFASFARRTFFLPWILWVFIGAGGAGTWLRLYQAGFYERFFSPWLEPVYLLIWSAAMAAIGLTSDIRQLLSDNGFLALMMAISGLTIALLCFFLGTSCIPREWILP